MGKVHWLHERTDVASDAESDLYVMAKKQNNMYTAFSLLNSVWSTKFLMVTSSAHRHKLYTRRRGLIRNCVDF